MLLLKLAKHGIILEGKQIQKISTVTGLIYGKHVTFRKKRHIPKAAKLYLKMTLKFPLTHFSIEKQKKKKKLITSQICEIYLPVLHTIVQL